MRSNDIAHVLSALDAYTGALLDGLASTRLSQERPQYEKRLVGAAVLYRSVRNKNWAEVLAQVESDERALGWSFFDGAAGEKVHELFTNFASEARRVIPAGEDT